jgi:hypothetical protein
MHACEHRLGDDPCVSGFCSRPASASSPSCRRRRRRTGPARRIRMWGPPWAFASSCAMAPRWCTITIRRHGTCDRSRGRAASAIMSRPGAGAGHGNIGRHSSIGAIASTGRGSGHPVGLTSRMATRSSGCMLPGTMDTQQSATASRTVGSSTDTPAPIATATDHDRRHAEAVLGTLAGRPRSPCWASHDARTCQARVQAAVRDLLGEPPIEAEQVMPDIANVGAGFAGFYAGHTGEAGAAETRAEDITCLFR